MNEHELLALAAKANGRHLTRAGYIKVDRSDEGVGRDIDWQWNPLYDDADAFQLMVELNIHITSSATHAWASTEKFHAMTPFDGNPRKATRWVITMVAAKIGEEME